jgi:intraflagellar transport protein 140
MWDIRTREHKTVGAPRKFEEGDRSLGEITALKSNREGGRIAILAKHADRSVGHGMNQMSVYVYDVETDSFMSYDCGPRHYPVACGWDRSDPRLLGCETRQLIEVKTEVGEIHQKIARAEIVTFFVTPDKGLMLQDRFSLQDDVKGLLGLTVPHIFLCSHEGSAGPIKLRARLMRDFVGMSEVNSETRKALLEFSFHLTNGNMDEVCAAIPIACAC